MRFRLSLLAGLAAFVAVSCQDTPVEPTADSSLLAQHEHGFDRWTDDTFTEFIPCGGVNELVDFTVSGMCQWQDLYDAYGGYHSEGVCRAQGVGIGQSSGSKWIFMMSWPTTYNVGPNDDYPLTYNDEYLSLWQGTAGVPSWNDWFNFHVAINANGEMTAYIDTHRFVCEGL